MRYPQSQYIEPSEPLLKKLLFPAAIICTIFLAVEGFDLYEDYAQHHIETDPVFAQRHNRAMSVLQGRDYGVHDPDIDLYWVGSVLESEAYKGNLEYKIVMTYPDLNIIEERVDLQPRPNILYLPHVPRGYGMKKLLPALLLGSIALTACAAPCPGNYYGDYHYGRYERGYDRYDNYRRRDGKYYDDDYIEHQTYSDPSFEQERAQVIQTFERHDYRAHEIEADDHRGRLILRAEAFRGGRECDIVFSQPDLRIISERIDY